MEREAWADGKNWKMNDHGDLEADHGQRTLTATTSRGEGLTHHDGPCHQQRAPVAELPEFPPVVLVAVELPVFLVVPVGEGLLAFRAPERQGKKRNSPGFLEYRVFLDPGILNLSGS